MAERPAVNRKAAGSIPAAPSSNQGIGLAGEWNGIPFQPHTLKIAGSTPVPAIIAEWSDGQGGTLIRCDMPVRIRLLQVHLPP